MNPFLNHSPLVSKHPEGSQPSSGRRICAVIPSYNAATTIGPLVHRIKELGLDPVVVDDGSTDATAETASNAGALVMSHLRNRGKGAALRTGFTFALREGYEKIVTLDSDGQHDPAEIPRLLAEAERPEVAIVLGHRVINASTMPKIRQWTNAVMSAIISRLAGQPIPDSQCGFRVIHRQALASMALSTSRFDFESELLLAAARQRFRIVSVPIQTIYERHSSHIHPLMDSLRFIRLLLRYCFRRPGRL